MTLVTCKQCGTPEDVGATYCGACGELLPPPPRAMTAARGPRQVVPLIAVLALAAVGSGAALWFTHTRSGAHARAAQPLAVAMFWSTVNRNVLAPVTAADTRAKAAVDSAAATGDPSQALYGAELAQSATARALAQLRTVGPLDSGEQADAAVVRMFLAANARYARTLLRYAHGEDFTKLEVVGQMVVSERRLGARVVPRAALPPAALFAYTESEADQIRAYIDAARSFLERSQATLARVKGFVPAATAGTIGARQAVVEAADYVAQRRTDLREMRSLVPPEVFEGTHAELIRSLELSLADDEALLAWAQARANGFDSSAALARVNSLGLETSAAKKQFLADFRSTAFQVTGSEITTPDSY